MLKSFCVKEILVLVVEGTWSLLPFFTLKTNVFCSNVLLLWQFFCFLLKSLLSVLLAIHFCMKFRSS